MILDQFNLSGKVALVTGCSAGLGEAMACGLAEAGADVAGVYNQGKPTAIEEKITALGKRFKGIQADLSSIAPIKDIIHKTIDTFGRVDILVNNAGIIRREKALLFSEKDWDDVMNVNIKSLFFLSQAVANQFVARNSGGKIINIASMLSFQGGILVPSYTASKSGVMGLTRLLACEWAPHHINVNAIAPGYMATRNTQALRDDPVRSKQILERIPAGRWGEPDDLKGAVVFLASEASNYMNGYTLAVDGGWLAR
ncbi:MAG: 2-dehydro-3-deoxy-D-gluconate 5-dehydrogenase KduD [Deltaproteobacteria bacterium]|nr:2-dehydro-3-deoxy-D-gluconate 5-dehydrogenase KduD [Deltaproteobacteria bacterium]